MEKYKLIKQIGEGSFATAWLAEETSGQQLVIKKYKAAEEAQARSEYIFLSALSSANVPRVIEYGSSPEDLFLAMEFISGKSPTSADFATKKELDTLFFKLCNQIVTIQSAGIVINDLKPDNLIIKEKEPWILDLGLAVTNNYNDGRFRGNIAYSSPEKIRHNSASFASDIFALGILYYYLSQGDHPSTKLKDQDWRSFLLDKENWQQWLNDQALPHFVKTLLSYDPSQRPSAVQALHYFAETTGNSPELNWSIIEGHLFPAQQNLAARLMQNKNITIHPDDEPQKVINHFILLSEAAGKPTLIIRDQELTDNPEYVLNQFQRLTDQKLNSFSDVKEFSEGVAHIVFIRNNISSPFIKQMQSRQDTFVLDIDSSIPPHLVRTSELNSYLHSTSVKISDVLPDEPLSIASTRLWLRSQVLPETTSDHYHLIDLSAALDHALPIKLIEVLEKDWLSQITAALQKGIITLSASDFKANYSNPEPIPDAMLLRYQTIASENHFHLYTALIAILRNDHVTAIEQINQQYSIFKQKGFFISAWQAITTLELKLGWQQLDFNLQKAKAFLARKLGDPALAIEIYGQIEYTPHSSQSATIAADIAIAYQENEQLDEAIAAYQQALTFFRSTSNIKAVLRCLNNIAAVHYQKNDYNQSSQIYLEMIRITESNEDTEYARNYHLIAEINLADIFLHKAQWKRALSYAGNAAQTAQRMQLQPFRYQAEFIAVAARFALGENDGLLQIVEQFISDKFLQQNPPLYQELAAHSLMILQFLSHDKAVELAGTLSNSQLAEFSPDLLLALFYYSWQCRQLKLSSQIAALIKKPLYQELVNILINPSTDTVLKAIQKLSRIDDSWLYITFTSQIALAGYNQRDKRIEKEISNLLKIYSFRPLEDLTQTVRSNTPQHLQLLWDVVSLIHDKVDFPQIMNAVLSGIVRISQLDRAVYFAWQDGKFAAMQGIDKNFQPLDPDSIQVSQTILQETLEKNEISFLNNLQSEVEFDIHSSIFGLGLRSAVCYPLILQDSVQGVIYSDAQSNRTFSDQEQKLLASILVQGRSAFEKAVLIQNIRRQQLDKLIDHDNKFDGTIIGSSPEMQKVFQIIDLVATHNVNVLITGDTGTGKELVAQAIHKRYAPDKPFTPLNCAAIPEALLESELFGYVKGAFTGAESDRKGLIEATKGGTLFLDEIGDMPVALQAKLLRVIQERQLTPVGSTKVIPVDVRIISATNRSLEKAIDNGSFRQDLYYRLKVIKIDLPSLNKRRQDIPLLVKHFIDHYNERFGKNVSGISTPALQLLQNKPWYGNIRELENDIERAMVLCQTDQLTLDLFEGSALHNNFSLEENIPLIWDDYKEYKRKFNINLDEIYAKKLLKAADNKISAASRMANISRTQIYRLMNNKDQ